jgi:heat shock protein HtpX
MSGKRAEACTLSEKRAMKRIFLFLATNLAVIVVLSIVISVLGLDRWLGANGIDYRGLLMFSLVVGFAGSIFSLLISKQMAKWSTGARIIDGTEGTTEYWLVQTVHRLADRAGIGHPEVAVYEGEPNAFATGAFKNSALVAVSTGLLQGMSREQAEAVLGHEISHVSNGDMITLTLIQGVVNTFVVFLSRVVGYVVDRAVFKTERGVGPGFYITMIVSQIVLGILASIIVAWFSRYREFRADAGSAELLGTPQPMISALSRLGQMQSGELPDSVKTFGINSHSGMMALFASHPPIEERIAALQRRA